MRAGAMASKSLGVSRTLVLEIHLTKKTLVILGTLSLLALFTMLVSLTPFSPFFVVFPFMTASSFSKSRRTNTTGLRHRSFMARSVLELW